MKTRYKMNEAISHDVNTLAEDARALVTATTDAAGEKVTQARERLSSAMESGKDLYGRVRDQAVEGAKSADHIVRGHSYEAIGIAVAIGAFITFLFMRRG